MEILQIINGTIDPGWVMLILSAIAGFFGIRTLNKIEKNVELLTKKIEQINDVQIEHGIKIKTIQENFVNDGPEWAQKLIATIAAITPPGPRRKRYDD
jgi:hypothetical protein